MSGEVAELQARLKAFARVREWEQFHSPKNLSMALIAEAAELIEHFQWLSQQQSKSLPADKLDEVALELADIFIFLLRISDELGIDLVASARRKIEINEQRYPVDKVRGSARKHDEY